MKKILLLTFSILVLSAQPTYGTPKLTEGIVIDDTNNYCYAYYGYGYEDSFNGNRVYFPTTYVNLKTDYGNCYLEYSANYQECCEQLGLTSYNFDKIKNDYKDLSDNINNNDPRRCGAPKYYSGIGHDGGISINTKTQECTARYIEAYKKNNEKGGITIPPSLCINNDWVEYTDTNLEQHIITPLGECKNFYQNGPQNCCQKLGLDYKGNLNAENDENNEPVSDTNKNTEDTNSKTTANANFFITFWKSILKFISELF